MGKTTNYWIVKTDPDSYSIDDFVKDKETVWDGVRNYQARNNLNLMKKGDLVLIYHSNAEKAIMGLAKVSKPSYQDPTTDDERWTAVDLKLSKVFKKQPDLAILKQEPGLSDIGLIKQSRLSVMPITQNEYELITELTK